MKKVENMPSWVYWGLFGIDSRKVAMAFFIVCVVLTPVIIYLGIAQNKPILFSFPIIPAWYWFSLKWVDNNSTWDKAELASDK
jgi:hypothetical protein